MENSADTKHRLKYREHRVPPSSLTAQTPLKDQPKPAEGADVKPLPNMPDAVSASIVLVVPG